MGLMLRLAKWRLRHWLTPGEVLLDYDIGRLHGTARVSVVLSDRAMYLKNRETFGRFSYATIASVLLHTHDVHLAVWRGHDDPLGLDVVVIKELVRGTAARLISDRLLGMSRYSRTMIIGEEPWTFTYHPWPPGTASRWVVGAPAGAASLGDREEEYLAQCIAEVEGFAAGTTPGPEWSATPLPPAPLLSTVLDQWMRILGGDDRTTVALAQSSEATRAAHAAVLVVRDNALRIADIDLDAATHPRIRECGYDSIEIGTSEDAAHCPITIKDPALHRRDWDSYFLRRDHHPDVRDFWQEATTGTGYLESLRQAVEESARR